MNAITAIVPAARTTTPKDWEADQEVRWCAGCGDSVRDRRRAA